MCNTVAEMPTALHAAVLIPLICRLPGIINEERCQHIFPPLQLSSPGEGSRCALAPIPGSGQAELQARTQFVAHLGFGFHQPPLEVHFGRLWWAVIAHTLPHNLELFPMLSHPLLRWLQEPWDRDSSSSFSLCFSTSPPHPGLFHKHPKSSLSYQEEYSSAHEWDKLHPSNPNQSGMLWKNKTTIKRFKEILRVLWKKVSSKETLVEEGSSWQMDSTSMCKEIFSWNQGCPCDGEEFSAEKQGEMMLLQPLPLLLLPGRDEIDLWPQIKKKSECRQKEGRRYKYIWEWNQWPKWVRNCMWSMRSS